MIDSAYIQARQSLDSDLVIALIDSAYIQARQSLDSDLVIALVDSAYIQARQSLIDSSSIISLIDSNYVVNRSADYIEANIQALDLGDVVGAAGLSGQFLTSLGTGDGSWVSITNIIDSAYVQLRQVDLQRDSAFIVNIIDSAYVQARQSLDSDLVIALVDSDYVRARESIDSARVITLIDSAYVQARQSLDSDLVIALVDSDYVKARQTNYLDSALSIQLIDSDYVRARQLLVDSASIINLVDSNYVVNRSTDYIEASIQSLDLGDVVGAAGLSGQFLTSLGTGDGSWVSISSVIDSAYVQLRQVDYLDSALSIQLIDSAYIQFRQINYLDSSLTTQLIDSAYIQARQSLDSDLVNNLIDSAYIQARQKLVDSASIINLVDSAYIQLRQIDYLDSSLTIQLIDSAYVQARQSVDSSAIISLVDSAYVINRSDDYIGAQIQAQDLGDIVGAAGLSGQYLRSLGTGDGEWITIAAPSYINLNYDSSINNDSTDIVVRMPVAGKITHLSLQLNVDTISAGQTLAFNLKKNGVLTGESISIAVDSAGSFGNSSSITNINFVANDLIAVNLVPSGSTSVTSLHKGLIRLLENI